jgi:UDP-2,4-diacetamido-2,4,6-trideoxy-beta-L-altropyranose hydrolase
MIGTGHVMRCLAIAQAWKRARGEAEFVLVGDAPGIADRLVAEGFPLRQLPRGQEFQKIAAGCPASAVAVLDGYGFGRSEQETLLAAGLRVLFLDDYGHADHYSATWVLNSQPYGEEQNYARREPETRLLLGPAYTLLREEFLPWIGWRRSVAERPSTILVTMGGSDANNASLNVVNSLASSGHPDIEVVLVIGSSNPHREKLQQAANQYPGRIRTVHNVSNMPELMASADIVVAAAGGTSCELAYMGAPAILFVAAENQRRIAEHLHELGVAINAGVTNSFDHDRFAGQLYSLLESQMKRQQMSDRGRSLIDGLGADRVGGIISGRELQLRRAQKTDCKLLFEWANDPVTRMVSFHTAPISWEEHTRWFNGRLEDSQHVLYVGEHDGRAIGQVRFEVEGDKAVLSINVAPEIRGEGWGSDLLRLSIRTFARASAIGRIDALVKPDNSPSVRLFEKSGFRVVDAEAIEDQPAVRFSWECKIRDHAK